MLADESHINLYVTQFSKSWYKFMPYYFYMSSVADEPQQITSAIPETDSGLVSFQQSVMSALGDAQSEESMSFVPEQTLVTSTSEMHHQPEQNQAIASIQESTDQNVQNFQPQDNSIVQVNF